MVAAVSAVSSASGATQYYEGDGHYAKHAPEHQKGCFWQGTGADFITCWCL